VNSWNVEDVGSHTYVLLNSSDTLIKLHKQMSEKRVFELMSRLEEVSFPLIFTEGLREVYLTYLNYYLAGDYDQVDRIRVSCSNRFIDTYHASFIHEVAHHLDNRYEFSSDKRLIKEWKKLSGSFEHVDINDDVMGPGEYVAIGFERYYTDKNFSSKTCPILWTLIDDFHRKNADK